MVQLWDHLPSLAYLLAYTADLLVQVGGSVRSPSSVLVLLHEIAVTGRAVVGQLSAAVP